MSQVTLDQCAGAYVAFRQRRQAARRQGLHEPPWLKFREERLMVLVAPCVAAAGRKSDLDYGRRWFE
jgi:hypothetical protein